MGSNSTNEMRGACIGCRFQRRLDHHHHCKCKHPSIRGTLVSFVVLREIIAHGESERQGIKVIGDSNGIKSGWFNFPVNFDPIWLLSCTGREEIVRVGEDGGE